MSGLLSQATVAEKLLSIEWDFVDSRTRDLTHAIHPYPAKFIPDIPRELIRLFHPGDESAVLDPFCGSGTTLVEAVRCGLGGVGIDLNPLATLIARVKTTRVPYDIHEIGLGVILRARQRVKSNDVSVPAIPRLDHWFQVEVQRVLAALIAEINLIEIDSVANALRVAFSSIVVRVSNQDSDTRYAAVEKAVTEDAVWPLFERAVQIVSRGLDNLFPSLFESDTPVQILTQDLMTVRAEQILPPVGLVVTSPPYPNAYEYWLYHKYRMYWLGMNPISVREREIGARPHYFKKNHQTEIDFEDQMRLCFALLSNLLAIGRYACFVVGRSIIHGRTIDNVALLERAADGTGFRKVGFVDRAIASSRKSFNLTHGTITREGILIFRREPR